jgi:hypothetical protein
VQEMSSHLEDIFFVCCGFLFGNELSLLEIHVLENSQLK